MTGRTKPTAAPMLLMWLLCTMCTEPAMETGNPPRMATSITVSPDSLSLHVGETARATCTPWNELGTPLTDVCTWRTSDSIVVRVSATPTQTMTIGGLKAGTAEVSAWVPTSVYRDTVVVTVVDAESDPPQPPTSQAGCPVSGYTRLVNVSTPVQLNAALVAALPGDQIRMGSGTYSYANGEAIALNRAGTSVNRITLCGPRTAIIRGGIIRADAAGDYWHLKGFSLNGNAAAPFAVWGNGADHVIYDSLSITNTTQEGIIIKTGPSFGNEIRYLEVDGVGLGTSQFGECIYIGSGNDPSQQVDSTWVHHNTLRHCSAEGIEIKAGADYSLVEFNTLDSVGVARIVASDAPIEIRASNTRVFDNLINWSNRYAIEMFADDPSGGRNNVYRRNRAARAMNGKMFGQGTNHGSPLSGNVFACDNVPTPPMTLGVTCSP